MHQRSSNTSAALDAAVRIIDRSYIEVTMGAAEDAKHIEDAIAVATQNWPQAKKEQELVEKENKLALKAWERQRLDEIDKQVGKTRRIRGALPIGLAIIALSIILYATGVMGGSTTMLVFSIGLVVLMAAVFVDVDRDMGGDDYSGGAGTLGH